jgi:hypothetical protein
LFLAGQTCVLPIPASASTAIDEHNETHAAHSAAPAPSSGDGHDHGHAPGMAAHCADSAVGHASAHRAPIASEISVRPTLIVLLLRAAPRPLEAPPDVGGPALFLLHTALLIWSLSILES